MIWGYSMGSIRWIPSISEHFLIWYRNEICQTLRTPIQTHKTPLLNAELIGFCWGTTMLESHDLLVNRVIHLTACLQLTEQHVGYIQCILHTNQPFQNYNFQSVRVALDEPLKPISPKIFSLLHFWVSHKVEGFRSWKSELSALKIVSQFTQ